MPNCFFLIIFLCIYIYIHIHICICILLHYHVFSLIMICVVLFKKNICRDDKIGIREIREDGCPPFPPKNRHSLTCRRDDGNDSWMSLLGIWFVVVPRLETVPPGQPEQFGKTIGELSKMWGTCGEEGEINQNNMDSWIFMIVTYIYIHNYMVLELIWYDYRVYGWFWMCMVNISIVNGLHKSAKTYSRVTSTLSFMDISWYPPKKNNTSDLMFAGVPWTSMNGTFEGAPMSMMIGFAKNWTLSSNKLRSYIVLLYFFIKYSCLCPRFPGWETKWWLSGKAFGIWGLPKNTQEWGQTAALRLHQAEHFNRGRSALDSGHLPLA